jgi:hypothetical protein
MDKMLKRPVIGGLCIPGETATRQLSRFEMISDAVAADTPLVAGVIGAGACLGIFFLFAFH